ncbi:hypothetical protein HED60_10395 [Planctomycetales bacterium ZRK34]|nr:hypothetical protein HED60_10395 [Planctomycetales bacterium ZRK34]
MLQTTIMRDVTRALCLGAVVAGMMLMSAVPSAKAGALETFDSYAAGSQLGGQGGSGGGWAGPWSAFYSSTFTEWNVTAGGLDGTANRLQFERDAGNRLASEFHFSRSATRPIASSPNTGAGPVYFGFYFQHDAALAADNSTNSFLLEWRTSDFNRYLTFGIEGDEVFVETDAGTPDKQVSNADLIADGVTYQIVVKLEQDAGGAATVGGGTAEKVSIFINPDSATEPVTADFVYTGGASIVYNPGQTFNRVRLFGDYYGGQYASVDRLVLADNFATAYIPEPATAALLGLAAPLLMRRRRV